MSDESIVGTPYPSSEGAASRLDSPSGSVYARTVKGGAWFSINAFFQKVIQIVLFVILARLLAPEDYGVLSVIFIVTGLFDQLTHIPFGTALIQRAGNVEKYLDPFWTWELLRAGVNAVIIAVLAGWIATLFGAEAHVNLIRVSGLLAVFACLSNVRTVYLDRSMDFRRFAFRDIAAQVVYGIVTLCTALWISRSVVALLAGLLAMRIFSAAMSYWIAPGRPRFSFALGRLKDLAGYSKWLYGQGLVDYAAQFLDKIFLGITLAPAQLGLYAKAKDLSTSPSAFVTTVARKVGLSAFALVQDDRVKVRSGMLRGVDLLFLTVIPAALLFLLQGGAIIYTLLGPNWLSIVVPFKIFSVGSIFLSVGSLFTTIVMAVGKPKAAFMTNVLQTVLFVPFSWIGIQWGGVAGLAMATSAVWVVMTLYLFLRIRHAIQLNRFDVVRYALIGMGTAVVLTCAELTFGSWVRGMESNAISMAWIGCLGILYFLTLFVMGRWWKPNPLDTGLQILRELIPARVSK
jgi:O-antigen/teichoic acid export membrane protein